MKFINMAVLSVSILSGCGGGGISLSTNTAKGQEERKIEQKDDVNEDVERKNDAYEDIEFNIDEFGFKPSYFLKGKKSLLDFQFTFRIDHARDRYGAPIYDDEISGYRLKITPCIRIDLNDASKELRHKCKNVYSSAKLYYKSPKKSFEDISQASGQEIFVQGRKQSVAVGKFGIIESRYDYHSFEHPKLCSDKYDSVCQIQARIEVFYKDLQLLPEATESWQKYPPMRGTIKLDIEEQSSKWRFCHYEEGKNECDSLN